MSTLLLPPGSLNDDIYLGFWINRSIIGARRAALTLDRQRSNLLIACLALFVGASGRGLWKIIRYFLFSLLSTRSQTDGIYQQRQAILRNSVVAYDSAIALLESCLAWRKKGTSVRRRTIPMALLTATLSVAFTIAGVFSSKVASAPLNEALISGKRCGSFYYEGLTNSDTDAALVYSKRKFNDYLLYTDKCYQANGSTHLHECTIFTRSNLPYNKDSNASCPFKEEMCRSKRNNLVLNTPYLDSYKDLGMNRGPRFLLRHKMQCAPLVTDGFTEDYVDPSSNKTYRRYKYGHQDIETSFLYQVQVNATSPGSAISGDYKVILANSGLYRPDAETSLFFLDSSTILYTQKTEDPWFSATTLGDPKSLAYVALGSSQPLRGYVADEPFGVMACAFSRYYCDPNLPRDTGCVNVYSKVTEERIAELWPDLEQQTALRFWFSKAGSTVHYSFSMVKVSIILLVGGLLLLVSTFHENIIELAFKFLFLRNNINLRCGYAEWQAMSTLQLQRQAHEGLGLGTWSKAIETVPITQPGDALGVLDISDEKHPRLVPPTVELVEQVGFKSNTALKVGTRYLKLPNTDEP